MRGGKRKKDEVADKRKERWRRGGNKEEKVRENIKENGREDKWTKG